MIKQALTLLLALGLLGSCSKDSSSDSAIDGTGVSKVPIATPGMGKTPQNPIPETEWKGDWNDEKNPNYHLYSKYFYNPIEGYWILTAVDGKPTDQFLAYEFIYGGGIALLTKKPAPGETPYFKGGSSITYNINDTQIKVRVQIFDSTIYNYQVAADRSWMTLNDGSVTYTFGIYDYNGIFYWKGDWNNPINPYYFVYEGKYNPILGEWEVYLNNGKPLDYKEYYRFSENLIVSRYRPKSESGYTYGRRYEINDTGIHVIPVDYVTFLRSNTQKYWIEGDTLYMQGYQGNKLVPEMSKLVRKKK